MSLWSTEERSRARDLARLTYANPFLPERVELERRVLGDGFTAADSVWHPAQDGRPANPNLDRLHREAEDLAESTRARLAGGARPEGDDADLYRDVVFYALYQRLTGPFYEAIQRASPTTESGGEGGGSGGQGRGVGRSAPERFTTGAASFRRFEAELDRFLGLEALAGLNAAAPLEPAHVFACFWQVRRAFQFIFRAILGRSMPVARLRAEVWQSIFTHDLKRYQRSLFRMMGDVPTLVTGPSGTGKELVARAVGLARYIPFDPETQRFKEGFEESFFPLNLSALSPTLIESELFGHRRGAFTGAVEDREGWLEVCPPLGTVFLDEIGELDPSIQVKLLRVLETRSFERLGETRSRRFAGKVVTATNRDLAVEMAEGRFREDLYYRLCADKVVTPSLAERVSSQPEEMGDLVRYLAAQSVGEEEADELAREVLDWIEGELGADYPWPGNVRELGQCVRNILIRRRYQPIGPLGGRENAGGPAARLAREVEAGELSADELLDRYVTLVYARAGSYQEAGRRLGLDRRTVKTRVRSDLLADLLEELEEEGPSP